MRISASHKTAIKAVAPFRVVFLLLTGTLCVRNGDGKSEPDANSRLNKNPGKFMCKPTLPLFVRRERHRCQSTMEQVEEMCMAGLLRNRAQVTPKAAAILAENAPC